ncbi:MAG: aromatic amino acid ammonia-lyase [Pseudomonadota bacterium]
MTLSETAPVALDRRLDLQTAEAIVDGARGIVISDAAARRLSAASARCETAMSEARHIYGITTGFGPLANRLVPADRIGELQQNLVYHLATGVGPPFSWRAARAIVLARLMSLLQGVSAATPDSTGMLAALLNSDLAPEIAERGTVGASGDLTPLAHLVLCLQGRGTFLTSRGGQVDASAALSQLGRTPLTLAGRDGLALVNGTSAMTGVAILNACAAKRALDWAIAISALMGEALGAQGEAWNQAFADVRPHPGQARVTSTLNEWVRGSNWINGEPIANRRLRDLDRIANERAAGQDAYSLRCVPQILGGVADALEWHATTVEGELASATDNPIFPETGPVALHGGNFMGVPIALASDALGNAVTVLAGLAERQVARITDEALNGGVPGFLTGAAPGLHSGFMGAQVTATALLAELRAIGPVAGQSISTNAANQDVVSMGTIAARFARDKLMLTFRILGIAALAAVQAGERVADQRQGRRARKTGALAHAVRQIAPPLGQDRPLAPEIEAVARQMERYGPDALIAAQRV